MKGEIVPNIEIDQWIDLIQDGKIPQGLKIGCELDEYLNYKQGTFNVVLGHSNVGKTLFTLFYLLCVAVKHDKKILVFSSENTIHSLKYDLIALYGAKKIEDMTKQEQIKNRVEINKHFKFIDTEYLYTYKDLINCFEKHIKEFDCAVIDPYNSLVKPKDMRGNSHEQDYQIASEFRIFCRTNKKTLYICAHAATEALRKVYRNGHNYEGHVMPPNSADMEGGGKWVNRADDFIVLHRLTQHEQRWAITEIHVKKIKETRTGGRPTYFKEPVEFRMYKNYQFFCMNEYKQLINPINGHPYIENNLKIDEPERY